MRAWFEDDSGVLPRFIALCDVTPEYGIDAWLRTGTQGVGLDPALGLDLIDNGAFIGRDGRVIVEARYRDPSGSLPSVFRLIDRSPGGDSRVLLETGTPVPELGSDAVISDIEGMTEQPLALCEVASGGDTFTAVYRLPDDGPAQLVTATSLPIPGDPGGAVLVWVVDQMLCEDGSVVIVGRVELAGDPGAFRYGVWKFRPDGTAEPLLTEGQQSPFAGVGVTIEEVVLGSAAIEPAIAAAIIERDDQGIALGELSVLVGIDGVLRPLMRLGEDVGNGQVVTDIRPHAANERGDAALLVTTEGFDTDDRAYWVVTAEGERRRVVGDRDPASGFPSPTAWLSVTTRNNASVDNDGRLTIYSNYLRRTDDSGSGRAALYAEGESGLLEPAWTSETEVPTPLGPAYVDFIDGRPLYDQAYRSLPNGQILGYLRTMTSGGDPDRGAWIGGLEHPTRLVCSSRRFINVGSFDDPRFDQFDGIQPGYESYASNGPSSSADYWNADGQIALLLEYGDETDFAVVLFDANRCLPDTNNDGVVNPTDFTAWVIAYNARTPACDQNGDGLCTPQDFTSWVRNFNAGC
ncbi:MAG: GC-type dockerin domain-anchored protein [Planctomycetota bacterium]